MIILIMANLPVFYEKHIWFETFVETVIGGFSSVWLGTIIFSVFGLEVTPMMIFSIGLFFFVNFLIGFFMQNYSSEISLIKISGGIACLIGVMIGGKVFL